MAPNLKSIRLDSLEMVETLDLAHFSKLEEVHWKTPILQIGQYTSGSPVHESHDLTGVDICSEKNDTKSDKLSV